MILLLPVTSVRRHIGAVSKLTRCCRRRPALNSSPKGPDSSRGKPSSQILLPAGCPSWSKPSCSLSPGLLLRQYQPRTRFRRPPTLRWHVSLHECTCSNPMPMQTLSILCRLNMLASLPPIVVERTHFLPSFSWLVGPVPRLASRRAPYSTGISPGYDLGRASRLLAAALNTSANSSDRPPHDREPGT